MIIETRSVPGDSTAPGDEGAHHRIAPEPGQLRGPITLQPGQDDDDQRQLEREPEREHHLQHEIEVGVVGDERLDGLGLEAEQHPERLRHDEHVRHAAPVRNSTSPTNSAGTSARFSRAYSAGARNAQSCQRMIGEASTSPTMKPSLKTIITGSVGLVTISFPPAPVR